MTDSTDGAARTADVEGAGNNDNASSGEPVVRRRRIVAGGAGEASSPSAQTKPAEKPAARRNATSTNTVEENDGDAPVRRRSRKPSVAAAPAAAEGAQAVTPPAMPPPRRPKIGDTRPQVGDAASAKPEIEARNDEGDDDGDGDDEGDGDGDGAARKRRRRGGRGRGRSGGARQSPDGEIQDDQDQGSSPQGGRNQGGQGQGEQGQGGNGQGNQQRNGQNQRGNNQSGNGAGSEGGGGKRNGRNSNSGNNSGNRSGGNNAPVPVEAMLVDEAPLELDEKSLEARRGKERKGRPVGRYLMCVHVHEGVTHIAILEGRTLIEHYVSRPSDDVSEIHGNVYLGRVQNVLPGMEAAFVDIGTPKNAVLYRGDVTYDKDDLDGDKNTAPQPKAKQKKGRGSRLRRGKEARIEELLKARQTILTQVTKNPIAHKGARLSTEVSLSGRFVVLVPNSSTYGISKRLPEKERKRLRNILDKVKPAEHGVIVRTASENVTAEEIERDVKRLVAQWEQINQLAATATAPNLLFREPELAVRVIREEFSKDYRGVIIDDPKLYEQVKSYMETITPALADRIEFHDNSTESLPLFERHHVAEQLHKAVDRKVWLPSGGSLIIEGTEALTVIDVNTGKNVGKSNLEETVFRNNLEAATEIAKHLRLRDIGGIIVIDFIDMEIRKNRTEVVRVFEEELARDKTRTHVSEISELGLVQMTRKRIGEGLLESVSTICEHCDGRGVQLDPVRLTL
jgi:ribonuclease E